VTVVVRDHFGEFEQFSRQKTRTTSSVHLVRLQALILGLGATGSASAGAT